MITRRDFLKAGGIALAGGLAAASQVAAQANPAEAASTLYKGVNLKGWNVTLGDALYNAPGEPPVDLTDIRTIHRPGYSELQANVKRREIMAHNIIYKRIIDTSALTSVHTCAYRFRLPYLPRPVTTDLWNGETIEGGIFVWDGAGTRFDYGLAFQWVINPWSNKKTFLNTWVANDNQTDVKTKGKWVKVGEMAINTSWHLIEMTMDVARQTAAIVLDGKHYPACFSRTSKEGWGTEVAARLQAEIVSIYPGSAGFKVAHKAQFKTWSWKWEPS